MQKDAFRSKTLRKILKKASLGEIELRKAYNTSYWLSFEGKLFPMKDAARRAIETDFQRGPIEDFQSVNVAAYITGRSKKGIDVVYIKPSRNIVTPEKIKRDTEIEQQRIERIERISRRDQAEFRRKVLKLYGGECAVSSCTTMRSLEAAHVVPVSMHGSNLIANSLLLRADLHRLFDADMMAICPSTGKVHFSEEVSEDDRMEAIVRLPKSGPALRDFRERWRAFKLV